MTYFLNTTTWLAWRRVALVLAGVSLALVLGMAWLGFPGFVTRWILAGANEGPYFVEAHHLRLDLRGGLKASDVAVYRKGVVGPPFLEARELRVVFRFLERPRSGVSRVKVLQARGGVIRPDGGPPFLAHNGDEPAAGGLASGKGSHGLPVMNLDVEFRDFEVMGVYVDPLHAELHVGGEGIRISGVSGTVGHDLQRGAIEGNVAWTWSRQASGRLVTGFDPRALIPVGRLFSPDAAAMLERFSFSGNPPRLELSLESDMGSAWFVRVKSRMQATRYAYRGAGIGFANITAEYVRSNGVNRLKLDPFLMVVGGRNVEGRTEFDFNAGTAEFDVISAIDLATVLRLSGIREQMLEAWHLEEGARLLARGRIDYHAPERSVMEASVEGGRIGYSRIKATDYGFRFASRGLTNQFTDIAGKIGNGSFSGSVMQMPATATGQFVRVWAELIHVDVAEVLKSLTPDPAWLTDGKVYGNVELAGTALEAATGQGQLTVRNCHLFKLPVFAGLMVDLGRSIPELDFVNSLVDVHLSYEIRNGRLVIRQMQIDDGPITMTATGSCGWDGTLDVTVEVHLVRKSELLIQTVRGPFTTGHGYEFTVAGKLTAPKWSRSQRR